MFVPPETEDAFPDLFMAYKFKLRMTRILGDHIVSSSIAAKIEYALNPEASADQMVLAWNKIDLWIESLNQCIAISAGNPLAVGTMISGETQTGRFANMLMILPGEPSEELLAYVIQAKFNALAEDVMAFGPVEMDAEEAQGVVFTISGDADTMLPNMEEWMGTRNWFTKPWWNRDDGSILDSEPTAEDDLKEIPDWAYNWDFLQTKPQPRGIVVSGRFKPRVIDDEE